MNNSIIQTLLQFFRQIYLLGNSIYIYNDSGLTVTLNDFFVALAIMGVVLLALVNFAKSVSVNSVSNYVSDKKSADRREKYRQARKGH